MVYFVNTELTNRCIYFVRNNTLYKKTVGVHWDSENLEYSKSTCSKEIYEQIDRDLLPCLDVSSTSSMFVGKQLNIYHVIDDAGNKVRELWDVLNAKGKDLFPPGCYELLYLKSLSENQFYHAITKKSFYDIYHNPNTHNPTASKALAALQLLNWQNKLDYLYDMRSFIYWYMMNCYNALEYIEM